MAQKLANLRQIDDWEKCVEYELGKVRNETLQVYRYPERFNPKKPGEVLGWDSFGVMKFDGKNRHGVSMIETFHSVTYKNDDSGRAVGNLSETMEVKYFGESGQEIDILL
jgi:hypothetical protein